MVFDPDNPHAEYTKGKSEKPVKFFHYAKSGRPFEATVSYGDTRLVFEGQVVFEKTQGSFKFGEQFQIVLWTKNLPLTEERAINDGYSRIEIALPLEVGERMVRQAANKSTRQQNSGGESVFCWDCGAGKVVDPIGPCTECGGITFQRLKWK